jgi:hypothetical protein
VQDVPGFSAEDTTPIGSMLSALQAAGIASASGFGRLQQDVARAAGESGRLRRKLDTQRAAFAGLWDSAKVRHSVALLQMVSLVESAARCTGSRCGPANSSANPTKTRVASSDCQLIMPRATLPTHTVLLCSTLNAQRSANVGTFVVGQHAAAGGAAGIPAGRGARRQGGSAGTGAAGAAAGSAAG